MVSTRRQDQAATTRREILEAARSLFARQGYGRTTVAQVAEAAGVSVQTIYDSVGSKAALVTGLNDLMRDAADVPAIAADIDDDTSVVTLLAVPPRVTAAILAVNGDIVRATFGAADIEPELARVRDEGTRRHREAMRRIVERLGDLGALADGTDTERLADGIAIVTQPETWLVLIDRYGWNLGEAEAWAAETIRLLALTAAPPPGE